MSERERLGVWNPIEELTYSQEGLDTISQDLRGKINEEYGNLERQLEELDKDNRALLDSNLELIKELDEAREAICIHVREHMDTAGIENDDDAVIYFKKTFNEENYN